MKNILKFLFVIICIDQQITTQFMVVRKDKDGNYGPITSQDIFNQQIADIFWKYTWPSCIAQDLTDEEKKILLKPGRHHQEEQFIRSKLQTISPDLDVVFVPDTLYELFLLKKMPIDTETPLNVDNLARYFNMTLREMEDARTKEGSRLTLVDFVKSKINAIYNDRNKIIFSKEIDSENIFSKDADFIIALKVQKDFMQWLVTVSADQKFTTALDISVFIHDRRDVLIQKFDKPEGKESFNIILKCINLDYMTYGQNRALLLRGTSFIDKQTLFKGRIALIGTTISIFNPSDPYSISFGNSLFSGWIHDQGACPYTSFLQNENYLLSDMWKQSVLGYGLIINKFEYMDNYISNLFFISALCLEAAFFSRGEFFHSRTKPAVLNKKDATIFIRGISMVRFLDPLGIFLITRDPHKQAALFSDYLATHMAILQDGDIKNLTPEEIEGMHKLTTNQKELAKEYKIIEVLNRKTRAYKKRKASAKSVQQISPLSFEQATP